MKRILLLFSIVFVTLSSYAQDDASLPYWRKMGKRVSPVAGDSTVIYRTGKYYKIPYSTSYIDSLLALKISQDGSSNATTGNIKIGNTYGINLANNSAYFSFPASGYSKMHGNTASLITSNALNSSRVDSAPNYVLSSQTPTTFTLQAYSPSNESSITGNTSGTVTITYSSASGFRIRKLGASTATFLTDLLSAGRTYQYPNNSGTFALVSDIPSLSGYLPSTLASGKIFVGNGSNIATGVDLSLNAIPGPFSLSNAGVLTIPDASSATKGLLNDTDWNTFNDKVSGTGTVNRLALWSGTNAINSSSALFLTSGTVLNAGGYKSNNQNGDGFFEATKQTALVTGLSTTIRMYATGGVNTSNGEFGYVRRNNANSATIFREFIMPDQSMTYTLPTPASGSNSVLAGCETVNVFIPVQRFSNAGLSLNDGTTDRLAMYSSATNSLDIGSGFATTYMYNSWQPKTDMNVSIGSVSNRISTIYSARYYNSAAMEIRSTGVMLINTLGGSGGGMTSKITTVTGSNSSAAANAGTGDLELFSGNVTNASAVSSQVTGSVLISAGTATGSGAVGNISIGSLTKPNFQSMQNGMHVTNAIAVPIANPSNGYFVYGNSGNMTVWSSGGGITTIGNNTTTGHIIGNTATPLISAGAAAGTGASVTLAPNSTDMAGKIIITTGSTGVISGTLATVTFNKPYTTAPFVVKDASNYNANILSGVNAPYITTTSSLSFEFGIVTGSLAPSTTYEYTYHVIQ